MKKLPYYQKSSFFDLWLIQNEKRCKSGYSVDARFNSMREELTLRAFDMIDAPGSPILFHFQNSDTKKSHLSIITSKFNRMSDEFILSASHNNNVPVSLRLLEMK